MKKNILISVLFNIFMMSTLCIAQNLQFPTLKNVQVHADIVYNNEEQMFYYTYMLINGNSNTGIISDLAIDISNYPGALDIDTAGLRFQNDGFTEGSFRRHFPSLNGEIVPVGFLSTPQGEWTGELSNHLMATFNTSSGGLLPGISASGFELMSKGLPVIRRCIVSPDFDFDSLFSEVRYPNEEVLTQRFTDSVQNAGKFYGWTIGPMAPLAYFIPTDGCDTLMSYVNQSHALGWINNTRDDDAEEDENAEDGIIKNLDKRLNKVKDLLSANKITRAKNQVEKFLTKVEKLWARYQKEVSKNKKNPVIIFTSEAYALLKYNGEYLMANMEAQPPPLPASKIHQKSDHKANIKR